MIEHSSYKGLYGIKEFVELEKNIGETVMNMYYDNDNDIDEDKSADASDDQSDTEPQ